MSMRTLRCPMCGATCQVACKSATAWHVCPKSKPVRGKRQQVEYVKVSASQLMKESVAG